MAKIQHDDSPECLKGVEQWELSFFAGGSVKYSATSENSLTLSYKTKYSFTT